MWRLILEKLEQVEEAAELKPPEDSDAAHYARMQLANTLARAREILEALANDEDKKNKVKTMKGPQ